MHSWRQAVGAGGMEGRGRGRERAAPGWVSTQQGGHTGPLWVSGLISLRLSLAYHLPPLLGRNTWSLSSGYLQSLLDPNPKSACKLHAFLHKLQKESDRSRLVSVPQRRRRAK